jgi:homoserine O-acetyltransferase
LSAAFALTSITALAADFPAPKQGDWIAKDFKFHTGEADKMVDDRLATAITADANDFIYQWEASHDYNPAPSLDKIEATLLLVNAADDERNPPETDVTDAAMKRVKNGRLFLIPASSETRGHLTTGNAKFYKKQLEELLQSAPQRAM